MLEVHTRMRWILLVMVIVRRLEIEDKIRFYRFSS